MEGLGSPVARRFAASGASAIWIPFGIANDDLEDAMEHLGVALDSRYRKILDSVGRPAGLPWKFACLPDLVDHYNALLGFTAG